MGIFNFTKNGRPEEAVTSHNEVSTRAPREDNNGEELFSVPVKAGKRIYYFDVKSTRAEDYYITITESRKKQLKDGSFTIDKHKIHLYKEDFVKFANGFEQVIDYIKEHKPEFFEDQNENTEE